MRNSNSQPQITTGEIVNREYNFHLFIKIFLVQVAASKNATEEDKDMLFFQYVPPQIRVYVFGLKSGDFGGQCCRPPRLFHLPENHDRNNLY